jgi:hypothetical protein
MTSKAVDDADSRHFRSRVGLNVTYSFDCNNAPCQIDDETDIDYIGSIMLPR